MRRVRRRASEWSELIKKQTDSGQSAREFCAGQDICVGSFYRWRSQLRSEPMDAARFVEVVDPFPLTSSGVSIQVAADRVDIERGFDADCLQSVLAVLHQGAQ